MRKTIFIYMLKSSVVMFSIVAFAFMVVLTLGQISDLSRFNLGQADWTFFRVLAHSISRVPAQMQPSLPYVIFLSTALTFHRLVSRSEYVIIAQLGIHPARTLLPFAAAGLLMGVFYTVVVHSLSGFAYDLTSVNDSRRSVLSAAPGQGEIMQELVIEDGENTIYVLLGGVSDAGDVLSDVVFFHLDPKDGFLQRYLAKEVRWGDDGWLVPKNDPREVSEIRLPPVYHSAMKKITDVMMQNRLKDRLSYSIYSLPETIALARLVGGKVRVYLVQYHSLIALPALLAAVAFLSGAVIARPLARGGWVKDVLLVMGASWLVYILSSVMDALAIRGVYSPVLMNWLMPVLCLMGGLAVVFFKGARVR